MDTIVDLANIKLKFNNIDILTINKDNEIWFKAKDICEILQYRKTKEAITNNVDDEDKFQYFNKKVCGLFKGPTKPIQENTVFINESGLYSLILRSNKEEAKSFKSWVTKEVLPSIRKFGEYKLTNKIECLQDEIKVRKEMCFI